METYKTLQDDIRNNKLQKHICEFMDIKQCPNFGIMVPVPKSIDLRDTNSTYAEFNNPTKLNKDESWKIWTAYPQQRENHRTRSMNELLFCMLRSKHNATNL